jgi:hypothetical protein
MVASSRPTAQSRGRTPIRAVTFAVGATFTLVGILGFIPGITTHYGDMSFAGPESESELLGLFQVSILHNLVHLAFGVLGLIAARLVQTSRMYLVGGGATYLVLWVYGVLVDRDADANFVPVNSADNWLHFLLGVGMVLLGVLLWRNAEEPLSR